MQLLNKEHLQLENFGTFKQNFFHQWFCLFIVFFLKTTPFPWYCEKNRKPIFFLKKIGWSMNELPQKLKLMKLDNLKVDFLLVMQSVLLDFFFNWMFQLRWCNPHQARNKNWMMKLKVIELASTVYWESNVLFLKNSSKWTFGSSTRGKTICRCWTSCSITKRHRIEKSD